MFDVNSERQRVHKLEGVGLANDNAGISPSLERDIANLIAKSTSQLSSHNALTKKSVLGLASVAREALSEVQRLQGRLRSLEAENASIKLPPARAEVVPDFGEPTLDRQRSCSEVLEDMYRHQNERFLFLRNVLEERNRQNTRADLMADRVCELKMMYDGLDARYHERGEVVEKLEKELAQLREQLGKSKEHKRPLSTTTSIATQSTLAGTPSKPVTTPVKSASTSQTPSPSALSPYEVVQARLQSCLKPCPITDSKHRQSETTPERSPSNKRQRLSPFL